MRKIRILGIAPYEGLKNLMDQAAEGRNEIELHTIVADLSEALDYIQDLNEELFDAIISRGGTATNIKKLVHIPVFDILVSYYDIFNILKLAEQVHERFCFVCYPSLAEMSDKICRALNYDVACYVTNSWDESQTQVKKAISDGYQMILGDVSACRYAQTLHHPNMLVTTGIETIMGVFDRTVDFFYYFSPFQTENIFLRNYMTLRQELLVIYDKEGNLIYTSIRTLSSFLRQETRRLVGKVQKEKHLTTTRRQNRQSYQIEGTVLTLNGSDYVQFHITFKTIPRLMYRGSISFPPENDERNTFFSHLYNGVAYRSVREQVLALCKTSVPVFLEGPASVGKEEIGTILFRNVSIKNKTLFLVECQTFTEKELNDLIESVSSPFQETGCTFYFNHANRMDLPLIRHLLSYVFASGFLVRNRMIFSWQTDAHDFSQTSGLEGRNELVNKLGCSVISVPSLKELITEIPKLAAIYINDLNTLYSRQIFGITPEGATLLQGYHWPFNLDQLRRVIRDAYQMAAGPYIEASYINKLLLREKAQDSMTSSSDSLSIDLSGTLDEVTRRLVLQILKEEGFNQSKTAARLGISRTTLWRMLKI